HVRNVSGDTKITVGEGGKIRVKARKRVRGTSEERAKRLLENVEVRMEQDGDEVILKPHLYEQDRGWADLFRGGRVAVDFEITVPREIRIEAHTVSGDLELACTRGPLDVQSVSGDVRLDDVQGPLRLKTVSGDLDSEMEGDVNVTGRRDKHVIIGAAETKVTVKTMSGDLEIRASGGSAPEATATAAADQPDDVERTEPMEPQRPSAPEVDV